MKPKKPLELDGRTGEGGGQLVRISCALAAVTSQPIRITHVRGNREGPRGGGLKAQHVTSLAWLAAATSATVTGLAVGSHTLEFRPALPPTALKERRISIEAESAAASTLLILQAILPYLLFAAGPEGDGDGDGDNKAIELEIRGGTNVAFSLSWEYLDQVLLPTLAARFGVRVERKLLGRCWSVGPSKKGAVWFRIHPLRAGEKLRLARGDWDAPRTDEDFALERIDASILAPAGMHGALQQELAKDLDVLFPDVDVRFVVTEDSGHDARVYVLLVAHSKTGLRWGRDWLYDRNRKKKTPEMVSREMSRKVGKELYEEVSLRGVVDEYLQDQLVVFQALAEGRTSFARPTAPVDGDIGGLESAVDQLDIQGQRRMRKDKTHEPFGEGSTHTTTARWVAAELLPQATWFNKGSICEGAGVALS
ncbi:hypothetical protein JX266_009288 [Neoarthrinium moseri]|nr:hypothetical protein JX266_009288 [Neoarthrinium moseri]